MNTLTRRGLLPLAIPLFTPAAVRAQAPAVLASFSILGDLVRQLAGDRVALGVLAGPETDAHAFQPRPSEAEAVRRAAVIIRNGLGFEPWLDRLIGSTRTTARIVTATEGLTPLRASPSPGHSHGPNAPDPHAWQDVALAQSYVRTIAAGLAPILPLDPAPLLARLAALDGSVRAELAAVPEARRVLLTSHDAFGYFAAAYGVRVLAPQGIGSQAQPSAQAVAALIRRVREERITAIFIEGPGSQVVMQRLAQDAGAAIRGRLYADTLSPPGGPAATYEAMVRHNVSVMVAAMRMA